MWNHEEGIFNFVLKVPTGKVAFTPEDDVAEIESALFVTLFVSILIVATSGRPKAALISL